MKSILSIAVLCAVTVPVIAADEPAKKPAAGPLTVEITGKDTYPLDLNGATPKEYMAAIEAAAEGGKRPPPPPAIDVKVVVKNTGKDGILIFKSGDPFTIELTIAGKGSKNIAPPVIMTREFRIPEHEELESGATISFPIEKLASGMRGMSKFSYWTDAGEYTLTAKVTTGVSPAPAGAQNAGDGFGRVTATSAPFKLTVTPKK